MVCSVVCGIVSGGLCSDDANGDGTIGGGSCNNNGFGLVSSFNIFRRSLGGTQPIFLWCLVGAQPVFLF